MTGLGILLYLEPCAHHRIRSSSWSTPRGYDHAMEMYAGTVSGQYYRPVRWAFRIGELGLIACVLFHSLNGIRVVLFDFWPKGVLYQRQLFSWWRLSSG